MRPWSRGSIPNGCLTSARSSTTLPVDYASYIWIDVRQTCARDRLLCAQTADDRVQAGWFPFMDRQTVASSLPSQRPKQPRAAAQSLREVSCPRSSKEGPGSTCRQAGSSSRLFHVCAYLGSNKPRLVRRFSIARRLTWKRSDRSSTTASSANPARRRTALIIRSSGINSSAPKVLASIS